MPKMQDLTASAAKQAPKRARALRDLEGTELTEALDRHRERMAASCISIRQAAALLGIDTRQADAWVCFGDHGLSPWREWLLGVQADVAAAREARAAELRAIVDKGVRGSPGHLVMMQRELGNPSGLDRELELIRRSRWYVDAQRRAALLDAAE